ncbi:uncharacterized protein TrAFT101_004731 [Trichoderma asperellum]|uniref:uncharacterized protein n=1 Tax=Trichoderma asperellum TaxID=101201 RepID=UPI00331D65E2|nr:hypothetical protein TrAFT101_004731 [Trichoderma asperellum]
MKEIDTLDLDYVFRRPRSRADERQFMTQDEKEYQDPTKDPFKKSAKPLPIENIGLTF